MLDIVGNIHMSLTEISSITAVCKDIHMINCVASPKLVKNISEAETAQFHVVLQTSNSVFPRMILDKDTQIFISGHLSNPSPTLNPKIEVPSGSWMVHKGNLDIEAENEVQKACVSGSVYVAKVFWNFRNQWNSYVKVVEPSLGNVGVSFRLRLVLICVDLCGVLFFL